MFAPSLLMPFTGYSTRVSGVSFPSYVVRPGVVIGSFLVEVLNTSTFRTTPGRRRLRGWRCSLSRISFEFLLFSALFGGPSVGNDR